MSVITKDSLPQNRSSVMPKGGGRQGRRYLYALFFLLPGMLLFFVFLLLPLTNSFYYSLFDWNGFGPPVDYIGTSNYERLFNHNIFHLTIRNSLVIVILSIVVQLPLALSLALLVGYMDATGTLGGITLNQTGKEMECMMLVLMIYLTISLLISAFMNWYNRRIALVER